MISGLSRCFKACLFFILVLFFTQAFGAEMFQDIVAYYLPGVPYYKDGSLTSEQAQDKIINSLTIRGNTITSDEVIAENIFFEKGEKFENEAYEDTIISLKNLQVFSKIKISLNQTKDNKLDIAIDLVEKWTLLPYFIGGSGGGSSYFALGLYDTNFLGRFYTFNFTYACKNHNCSSVVYFRNPRIFGRKINYVFNPGQFHSVYYLYNDRRETIGAFSNQQNFITSYADFELRPSFSLGVGLVFQDNYISQNGLTGIEIQNSQNNAFVLPDSTSSVALEGRFSAGQINYDGIVAEGANIVSIVDTTAEVYSKQADNYSSINNTLLFFRKFTLLPQSYFAFRGNLSATSSEVLSQHYFVGGLDKIRGFYDGEFVGQMAWYTNAEARIPSYIGDYVALQHVFFVDSGSAANSFAGIFTNRTAASAGAGVRLLFLNINKIALRVDFAYTLSPFNTYGLSYGLMQFF